MNRSLLQGAFERPFAFPDSRWVEKWVFYLMLASILAVKAWDGFVLPQLWAEDGTDFFKQQYGTLVPQLLEPSSGYLHVLLRLVAWVVGLAPAVHAPALYFYAAVLMGGIAVGSFAWRVREISPLWLTLVIVGLMPISTETHGTLTNLQWFLQFALLSLVVPSPTGPSRIPPTVPAWRVAAIFLLGLTGPFSIILLFALGVLVAMSPAARAAFLSREQLRGTVVLAFAAVVQAAYYLLSQNSAAEGGSLNPTQWLQLAGAMPDVLQGHLLAIHPLPIANAVFGLIVAVVACTATWQALRSDTPASWIVALAILTTLAQAFLGVAKNASVPVELMEQVGVGDRYFLAFKISFWIGLASALQFLSRTPGGAKTNLIVLFALLGVCVIAPNHLKRPPLEDKRWTEEIGAVESGEKSVIAINPTPWTVELRPRREEDIK